MSLSQNFLNKKGVNGIRMISLVCKLTNMEKAYLSGLIDADGSILLMQRNDKRTKNSSIRLNTYFSSSNKQFIAKVSEMIGLPFKEELAIRKRQNSSHFRIVVNSLIDNLYFLEQLEPYLILKKEKAKIAIQFANMRLEKLSSENNSSKVQFGEQEYKLFSQMKNLQEKTYTKIPEKEEFVVKEKKI